MSKRFVKILALAASVAMIGMSLSSAIVRADDNAASKPAVSGPAASGPATSMPASGPTSKPTVVATIGDSKIMSDKVQEMMDFAISMAYQPIPASKMPDLRQQVVSKMIFDELLRNFVTASKIELTADELKAQKTEIAQMAAKEEMTVEQFMSAYRITDDRIEQTAKLKKIQDQALTKEKVDAYIKAHPDYFNGTTVKASHILIKCDPIAVTSEQKAALVKLEGVAKDIKDGKITFEDAAKKYSDCPSKEKGGDLGEEFPFTGQFDPTFAAVALDGKVGELSPIVHTRFGFHIIKVTARTAGKTQSEDAEDFAKKAIFGELYARVLELPLTTSPIVMEEK